MKRPKEILSPHLFWDVPAEKLDFEKDAKFLVKRVLEYGRYQDWKVIYGYYKIDGIAKITQEIRELDPVALHFISTLSGKPLDSFRCYTSIQSQPKHYHF